MTGKSTFMQFPAGSSRTPHPTANRTGTMIPVPPAHIPVLQQDPAPGTRNTATSAILARRAELDLQFRGQGATEQSHLPVRAR